MLRGFKMRIYPNEEQRHSINSTLGCCRYIYNKMLERNNKIYERRKEHMSYHKMQNLLHGMKAYLPWLKEADSQALKQACRQLDDAFQRFFKKQNRYPCFKSKHKRQSYTTTAKDSIHYEPGRVKLPKIGWIDTPETRELPGEIRKATVFLETDGTYHVSLLIKIEEVTPNVNINENNMLGLDYKSDGLYVDSNGNIADMPHFYRESQELLAKRQKQLAKKVGALKGEKKSSNYTKKQKQIAKLYKHIANQRKDFLHKLSTQIANEYDGVVVEDLNLMAMSNRGFGNGKATMDNGYGSFLTMLAYKLAERGKPFVKINRWYPSSQTCHACGFQNKDVKDLKVREWDCPVCGVHHDRDINAARNIRDEGLRMLKAS